MFIHSCAIKCRLAACLSLLVTSVLTQPLKSVPTIQGPRAALPCLGSNGMGITLCLARPRSRTLEGAVESPGVGSVEPLHVQKS